VAYIPLGGSEETHIIFEGNFPEHLARLDASQQRDLLVKLRNIAKEDAPPDSYVYEQIGNLDIIKFNEKGRVYAKVITYIPEGNTQFDLLPRLKSRESHHGISGRAIRP